MIGPRVQGDGIGQCQQMVDLSEICGLGSCGINVTFHRCSNMVTSTHDIHESPGKMFVLVCEMLTEIMSAIT